LAAAPVLLLHHLVTKRVTSSIIQYVNPRLRSSELQAKAVDLRIFLMGMQYEKPHDIETNK